MLSPAHAESCPTHGHTPLGALALDPVRQAAQDPRPRRRRWQPGPGAVCRKSMAVASLHRPARGMAIAAHRGIETRPGDSAEASSWFLGSLLGSIHPGAAQSVSYFWPPPLTKPPRARSLARAVGVLPWDAVSALEAISTLAPSCRTTLPSHLSLQAPSRQPSGLLASAQSQTASRPRSRSASAWASPGHSHGRRRLLCSLNRGRCPTGRGHLGRGHRRRAFVTPHQLCGLSEALPLRPDLQIPGLGRLGRMSRARKCKIARSSALQPRVTHYSTWHAVLLVGHSLVVQSSASGTAVGRSRKCGTAARSLTLARRATTSRPVPSAIHGPSLGLPMGLLWLSTDCQPVPRRGLPLADNESLSRPNTRGRHQTLVPCRAITQPSTNHLPQAAARSPSQSDCPAPCGPEYI